LRSHITDAHPRATPTAPSGMRYPAQARKDALLCAHTDITKPRTSRNCHAKGLKNQCPSPGQLGRLTSRISAAA
jgi:hypothetical protein